MGLVPKRWCRRLSLKKDNTVIFQTVCGLQTDCQQRFGHSALASATPLHKRGRKKQERLHSFYERCKRSLELKSRG